MTLKQQVETMLKEIEWTRDSDIELMLKVWENYYPQYIKNGKNGEKGVYFSDFFNLPTHESIKRIRAQFNADGKYYPTNLKVLKARKLNEDQWRMENGYPPHAEVKGLTSKRPSYARKEVERLENEGTIPLEYGT
jgi:hypothetical protein